MAKVVWIASYPKPGNTRVRFLIGNLLLSEVESAAQVGQRTTPPRPACGNSKSRCSARRRWSSVRLNRLSPETSGYAFRHHPPLTMI
jgi:hypothetical protein